MSLVIGRIPAIRSASRAEHAAPAAKRPRVRRTPWAILLAWLRRPDDPVERGTRSGYERERASEAARYLAMRSLR